MPVLIDVMPWDIKIMRVGLIRMIVNAWSICENELVTDKELNGRNVNGRLRESCE